MKNTYIFFIAIIFLVSFSSCSQKKEAIAEADIQFFYLEVCPSCEDYVLAEALANDVALLGGKALNIIHDEAAKTMKETLTEKNLENISHVLPLLVIKNEYFVGYEEISEKLGEY